MKPRAKRTPLLVSPGPVDVPDAALGDLPRLHHRSADFRAVLDESAALVREMIGASGPVAFLSASGTGGMEAAIVNATRPGERVLVVSGGKFGDRWGEIARAHGRAVSAMRLRVGAPAPVGEILARSRRENPAAVALTHVESSTGALAPVREIASGLGPGGPIAIVDAISSAGAEELRMDEWGIDVVVGASQKALGAPPGVCFVATGERAASRGTSGGIYYFDLSRYRDASGASVAPFTPAIHTMQVVHRSLAVMRAAGFAAVRERHRGAAVAFVAACEALGARQFADAPSSAVQVMTPPRGCPADDVVAALAGRGFIASGGQGPLAGSVVRTGFLGLLDAGTLAALVKAFGDALADLGFAGDGAEAARRAARYAEKRFLFGPARAAGR